MSKRTFHQHFYLESVWSHAYLSDYARKDTAVVFVHGLGGDGLATWGHFPMLVDELHDQFPWWRTCDLYFFGYESTEGQPLMFAEELRTFVSDVFPMPRLRMRVGPLRSRVQPDPETRHKPRGYKHLLLVAHSMGGFVVRSFLRDVAREYARAEAPEREVAVLHSAGLRLFAPALFGLRARGLPGILLRNGFWFDLCRRVVAPRISELVSDLSAEVDMKQLQRETEEFALEHPQMQAFRARIVWGQKDQFLRASRYQFDARIVEAKGKDHFAVCKPTTKYRLPLEFVRHAGQS